MVTRADGHAEREAAKAMIGDARQAVFEEQTEITLGADKGYLRIPVNVTADSGNVTGIPANVTEGRCCAF